jgi:uncharacterized protein (DUF1330 family)
MTAYVIADIQVTDPEHYQDYKDAVPQTIKEHGGRILARGGAIADQQDANRDEGKNGG